MENTFVTWECYDKPRHERGPVWYVAASAAALGLLIYAVLTANFLFALIVVLFALVIYLSSQAEPVRIRCMVSEAGVTVGNDIFPFRDIRRFWFVYQPPEVKSLYFETGSWVHPRISLDLEDMNPNDVRTALGRFVREDLAETEEPLSDYLSRILKL